MYVFRYQHIAAMKPCRHFRRPYQHTHTPRTDAGQNQRLYIDIIECDAEFRGVGRRPTQIKRILLQRSGGLNVTLYQPGD